MSFPRAARKLFTSRRSRLRQTARTCPIVVGAVRGSARGETLFASSRKKHEYTNAHRGTDNDARHLWHPARAARRATSSSGSPGEDRGTQGLRSLQRAKSVDLPHPRPGYAVVGYAFAVNGLRAQSFMRRMGSFGSNGPSYCMRMPSKRSRSSTRKSKLLRQLQPLSPACATGRRGKRPPETSPSESVSCGERLIGASCWRHATRHDTMVGCTEPTLPRRPTSPSTKRPRPPTDRGALHSKVQRTGTWLVGTS